jgi:hypothetical protein
MMMQKYAGAGIEAKQTRTIIRPVPLTPTISLRTQAILRYARDLAVAANRTIAIVQVQFATTDLLP